MTVLVAAEQISEQLGNVLRGASVAYGSVPFARDGRQGAAWRWRARWIGGLPAGAQMVPEGGETVP